MPNPRYIKDGQPTPLLEFKVKAAKYVYEADSRQFCNARDMQDALPQMIDVRRVYLIGVHARDEEWKESELGVGLKLVIPEQTLYSYVQRKVGKRLRTGDKPDRTHLFRATNDDDVAEPRFDVTKTWHDFNLNAPLEDLIRFKLGIARHAYEAEVKKMLRIEDVPEIIPVWGIYTTQDISGRFNIFLVAPEAPSWYKNPLKQTLDHRLHIGEEPTWIDVSFVDQKEHVPPAHSDITKDWDEIKFD